MMSKDYLRAEQKHVAARLKIKSTELSVTALLLEKLDTQIARDTTHLNVLEKPHVNNVLFVPKNT